MSSFTNVFIERLIDFGQNLVKFLELFLTKVYRTITNPNFQSPSNQSIKKVNGLLPWVLYKILFLHYYICDRTRLTKATPSMIETPLRAMNEPDPVT